ncbi:NAC domain-containing protein 83-like [Bidens hawaiensis]|uniref:NAC domain-containing protein 83-like n=1 Tax=Bidens hawaiensis TaxID=980011 RepID=UPI004048F28A
MASKTVWLSDAFIKARAKAVTSSLIQTLDGILSVECDYECEFKNEEIILTLNTFLLHLLLLQTQQKERFNYMENGILILPPEFRFHPTDEELVVHYLKRKVQSIPLPIPIPEADVFMSDPWNLPGDLEQEKYCFSSTDLKYPNGKLKRANRVVASGYWKSSGLDIHIVDSRTGQVIGMKKILVFYKGKSPKGSKTNWIMHEYKLVNHTQGMNKWVLCKTLMKKRARKSDQKDKEMIIDGKTGPVLYEFFCGSRTLDLNLEGCSSSSSCGVTVADEDEDDNAENTR